MKNNLSPWPSFTQEEADAASQVLLSNKVNYWTGGEGRQFEEEFANWCGSNYAVAVANGTLALDLALKALDISGDDDEVIVTPRSFIASVSSVVNAGATPVFADIDLNSGNITAKSIKAKVSHKTKAIICVHLAGCPCEMDDIMQLAQEYNLYVIEDCAQAHGAKYKGQPVGSIGHIGCWSFCQDKIMSTGGEGGMVTTSDESLWRKMWAYKDHGKSYEAVYEREHPEGFRWLHESFGTNWRMTEMQAAIGRIQLGRMISWHQKRKNNAQTILKTCTKFARSLRISTIDDDLEHAWYKLNVYVRPKGLKDGWGRDRISNEINQLGVACYSGSCSEIYLEKAFDEKFRPKQRLKNAQELGGITLMFLVHPTLTADEIQSTCYAINKVMQLASK
jgi:dTDP-4-amino-4,6-dideoxygalactose transaminase